MGLLNRDADICAMNPVSPVAFLRYWGSHLKSQRHAEVIAKEFEPLVRRGWRCAVVLERPPEDAAWLAPLTKTGVQIEVIPRPRRNFDWAVVQAAKGLCRRLGVSVRSFYAEALLKPGAAVSVWTAGLIGARLLWERHPAFAAICVGLGALSLATIYWRWILPEPWKRRLSERRQGVASTGVPTVGNGKA